MVGHSAVVDNPCLAGVGNLAVDIPAAQTRFAGSKAVVESCDCHRGSRLGR